MRRLAIIVVSAAPAVAQTAIPRTWDDTAIRSALLPSAGAGVRIEQIRRRPGRGLPEDDLGHNRLQSRPISHHVSSVDEIAGC
jgi:hypothetical protein